MSVKVITRKVNARNVSIKMVDGSLVHGKVNVYHDEEVVQRVSDIFTKVTDPFSLWCLMSPKTAKAGGS